MVEFFSEQLLTRKYLFALKVRAIRRGLWYPVLSRLERSIVELTISTIDKIKSSRLALVIGRIVLGTPYATA